MQCLGNMLLAALLPMTSDDDFATKIKKETFVVRVQKHHKDLQTRFC